VPVSVLDAPSHDLKLTLGRVTPLHGGEMGMGQNRIIGRHAIPFSSQDHAGERARLEIEGLHSRLGDGLIIQAAG